jgi:hypothetical protein
MCHSSIRVRIEYFDYSDQPDMEHDWARSVNREIAELISEGAPEPLGHPITVTNYVDANFKHDTISGKSVTGMLHMINKSPLDWYSNKQDTVDAATYGSEIVTACLCTEQIIILCNTLQYLGVRVRSKCYLVGDDESAVDSSMQVYA